jgi:hypothetical protein
MSKAFRKKKYYRFNETAYAFMTNQRNRLYKSAEMQAGQGLKKNFRC